MLHWQNDRPAWVKRALADEPRAPAKHVQADIQGRKRCICGVRFFPRNSQQVYHDKACKERHRTRARWKWRWGGG